MTQAELPEGRTATEADAAGHTGRALSPVGAALRVAGGALDRYAQGWWGIVDEALLAALYVFCFGLGERFDTVFFFTSAALPLWLLGAITAYALVHVVVSPPKVLALGGREGPLPTIAGLVLAVAAIRAIAGLILVGFAALLGRFTAASPGMLAAGALGLALGSALAGAVVVVLATPGAPRYAAVVALGLLVLGLAAYGVDGGPLGLSVWLCRLPLAPFASAYALGLGDIPPLAWLGALTLLPLTVAGLAWLAGRWLARGLAAHG